MPPMVMRIVALQPRDAVSRSTPMNPRIVPLLLLLLTGCSNVYYNAMEKVGFAKREILVDRVEDAQEAQQDAKEQFTSALDQLLEITRSDGGDLKATYNRLNSELRKIGRASCRESV